MFLCEGLGFFFIASMRVVKILEERKTGDHPTDEMVFIRSIFERSLSSRKFFFLSLSLSLFVTGLLIGVRGIKLVLIGSLLLRRSLIGWRGING